MHTQKNLNRGASNRSFFDSKSKGHISSNSELQQYFASFENIALLTKPEEQKLAYNIKTKVNRICNLVFASDSAIAAALDMLIKVSLGELRLDRTLYVSPTDTKLKTHLRRLLPINIVTIQGLLDHNQKSTDLDSNQSRRKHCTKLILELGLRFELIMDISRAQYSDKSIKVCKDSKLASRLEKIADLIEKQERHFISARNEFAARNLRLVVKIASTYVGRGLELIDLIEEGNIGLLTACVRFCPEKNFRFSTYATWWIRQAITEAVEETAALVRQSAGFMQKVKDVKDFRVGYKNVNGSWPTSDEVCSFFNIRYEEYVELRLYAKQPRSLNQPIQNNERHPELADFLPSQTVEDREHNNAILYNKLSSMMESLDAREQSIIKDRFGINQSEPGSLRAIGEKHGITRERVRQLEARALKRLAQAQGINELEDFF